MNNLILKNSKDLYLIPKPPVDFKVSKKVDFYNPFGENGVSTGIAGEKFRHKDPNHFTNKVIQDDELVAIIIEAD